MMPRDTVASPLTVTNTAGDRLRSSIISIVTKENSGTQWPEGAVGSDGAGVRRHHPLGPPCDYLDGAEFNSGDLAGVDDKIVGDGAPGQDLSGGDRVLASGRPRFCVYGWASRVPPATPSLARRAR
jgi:hypothetical protein